MTTSTAEEGPLAVDVSFTGHALRVLLSDGREVAAPLDWFPRLLKATPRQRKDWSLIGKGIGIHWESVDEDISVQSLLTPEKMLWCRGCGPSRLRRRRSVKTGGPGAFRTQIRNGRRALRVGA